MENKFKAVGFTGTRNGMTEEQVLRLEYLLRHDLLQKSKRFNHGDCIGADRDAHKIADGIVKEIGLFPCTLTNQRAFCDGLDNKSNVIEAQAAKHPLDRNLDIIASSDIMVGCPKGYKEERRGGTWHTIRNTRLAKKPLILIYPNGDFTLENI
ncbi:MAG TPA: hypothetical protein VMV86_06655 [Methanosarcinales archaeon]|nr:hypothetical protein [Methanosarcinales archaeon]